MPDGSVKLRSAERTQAPSRTKQAERPQAPGTNGARPKTTAVVEPALRLPDDAWLIVTDDYRRAIDGVTEAADEHHYFALLAVIGAILGRRVWIDYAYPLFPNFYSLNIGRSGSTKKTSAIRIAVDVGRRADATLRMSWTVGSGEGLLEALSAADASETQPIHPIHNRLLLLQGEMGQLLGKARQEGSSTLIPLLLEAFDAPPMMDPTTRNKPITATRPTLSMLAATTTAHLERYLAKSDVYGGLGSRLLIALGEPKDPIPMPRKAEPHRFNSVVSAIHSALERWAKPAEFHLSDKAEERWTKAYTAWKAREEDLGERADFVSRTHVYAMKMALLFAALENDTPIIELAQIEAAIQAADFSQRCALAVLGEMGDPRMVRIENRLMKKIGAEPGINQRRLQQYIGGGQWGCDSPTFRRIVGAMLEVGKVMDVDGGLHVGV